MKDTAPARALEGVYIAAALLLPTAILPGVIHDPAGLPKDVALGVLAACLVGYAAARPLLGLPALPGSRLTAPLLALAAAAVVSQLGARAPLGNVWPVVGWVAVLAFGVVAPALPDSRRTAQAAFAGAGIVALYGLGQYVGFDFVEWANHFRPRVFASMGNPVFLGGYLAAVFPVAFAAWLVTESEETKDLLTLLLALMALTVYLTWTRSAWFGLAAAVAVQTAALASTRRGRDLLAANRAWLLSGAVLALIAAMLISSASSIGAQPVPVGDRLRDAVNLQGYSVRFRLVTNEVGLRMARAHPLLGAGWGSYAAEYPWLRLGTRAARGAADRYFASQEMYAHDDHLQVLAETGVVGLGLWLWFLLAAARLGWHRARAGSVPGLGALGCLVAVGGDGLANFPLHIATTGWVFFTAVGLLGADGLPPDPAPAPAGRRRWAPLAVMLLPGILALRPGWKMLAADRQLELGDRQVASNNYEMASVYYEEGFRLAPLSKFLAFRSALASFKAARFEWQGRSADAALQRGRFALALGYEDENVYKFLSDVFERKSDVARAVRHLDLARTLDPRGETIANNLAYFLALSETRYAEAQALAEQAVKAAPDDPTYLDTLGYVLLRAGRPARAVPVLRKALARLPVGDPRFVPARKEIEGHLALALRGR